MTSTSLPARLTVTEDAMLDIPISVHPCSSVVEILYANVEVVAPATGSATPTQVKGF